MVSNYHDENLVRLHGIYAKTQLSNPSVIIDANHGNSQKDPFQQPRIVCEVLKSMRGKPETGSLVKGFMVESYLEDGSQPIGSGIYGKSITDACLGWEKTRRMIYEMAEQI